MLAIEVNKLVKKYKNGVRALDELSLEVKCGEIYSLLGPNGAGKSSLINTLTTYQKPTSGSAFLMGKDLLTQTKFVRTQIACVAQHVSIDDHLSLMENMLFQSRLYRVDAITARKRISELIECFGLNKYLKYPTASYSGGIKRRLDIAMNMVSYPKILFLDEPTVGMDIKSRKSMWEMMKRIRDEFGTTIFLTTHYLEEADELSDTICIMNQGHEIVQGKPSDLRQYTCQDIIRMGFDSQEVANASFDMLKKTFVDHSFHLKEASILVKVRDTKNDFTAINYFLLENQMRFISVEKVQPSLEDIFLDLTKEGIKEVEK